ncbi:MAG: cyclic nucleotide-binding domain-containing protein [Alphaproteobacteria bacterium]|nr:cyclic nucleotide-binding domain-containing protein [Alphaproteobacteria bacterium]
MKDTFDPRNSKDPSGRPRLLARDVFYKDAVIFEEGAAAHRAYYIESGRVEVSVRDGKHKVTISELGPGEIFGEMALLASEPRTATVKALETTTVTVISETELRTRLEGIDEAISSLFFLLIERLKAANKSQARHYRNLVDFQNRVLGIANRLDADFSAGDRAEMRQELEPLLDEVEAVLDKYARSKKKRK